MRAKEAVDMEAKAAQRSVEKQLRLLERAQEVEMSLRSQIVCGFIVPATFCSHLPQTANEKGLTALKNNTLDLQNQLATVVAEKTQLELRLQQSQNALAEAQQIMHQRVAEANAEKEARAKLQDEADGQMKTIKKLKERQDAVAAASQTGMSDHEWAITQERDKLLVSSSICTLIFVLTCSRNCSNALVANKTSSNRLLSNACTVRCSICRTDVY